MLFTIIVQPTYYIMQVLLGICRTVTDLIGDYDALSAADRERLDCPELR